MDWRGETTGGKADENIPVDMNSMLVNEKWNLMINVRPVVPHEVLCGIGVRLVIVTAI
jgi:hypothetical protein